MYIHRRTVVYTLAYILFYITIYIFLILIYYIFYYYTCIYISLSRCCEVNTPSIEVKDRFFAMRKAVKAFADSMLDLIVKDSVKNLVDFYNKDGKIEI